MMTNLSQLRAKYIPNYDCLLINQVAMLVGDGGFFATKSTLNGPGCVDTDSDVLHIHSHKATRKKNAFLHAQHTHSPTRTSNGERLDESV